MSYLNRIPERQNELKELIQQRLQNEEVKIRQRVYQWLNDNQYFVDNELFDFYFCVAQNLAAVEVLGASGDRILQAKSELEQSAQIYTNELIRTFTGMTVELETHLSAVRQKQDKLDQKLDEVLEGMITEHQNLQTISTGLVNAIAALLTKQRQMLVQTQAARKLAMGSVILAWVMPILALLGWVVMLFVVNKL